MSNLWDYWMDNIQKNIKKISAILGDIILTVFALIIIGLKADLDVTTVLLMILFSLKPFVTMYINIVFKGEAVELKKQNLRLQQSLAYDRELAEYRCLLAAKDGKVPDAVVANKDWVDANEALQEGQ